MNEEIYRVLREGLIKIFFRLKEIESIRKSADSVAHGIKRKNELANTFEWLEEERIKQGISRDGTDIDDYVEELRGNWLENRDKLDV